MNKSKDIYKLTTITLDRLWDVRNFLMEDEVHSTETWLDSGHSVMIFLALFAKDSIRSRIVIVDDNNNKVIHQIANVHTGLESSDKRQFAKAINRLYNQVVHKMKDDTEEKKPHVHI